MINPSLTQTHDHGSWNPFSFVTVNVCSLTDSPSLIRRFLSASIWEIKYFTGSSFGSCGTSLPRKRHGRWDQMHPSLFRPLRPGPRRWRLVHRVLQSPPAFSPHHSISEVKRPERRILQPPSISQDEFLIYTGPVSPSDRSRFFICA